MLYIIIISIISLILYFFQITIYNESVTTGIVILYSIYPVYFLYKKYSNIKLFSWSVVITIILWFILWFIINELPSYSLGLPALFIGIWCSSFIALFVTKKNLLDNKKELLFIILSYQILILLLANIFFLTPFGNNFVSYKKEELQNICVHKKCFILDYMTDPLFFWNDYILLREYYKSFPFILLNKNQIDFKSSNDIWKDINITYSENIYRLNYIWKWELKTQIIK